MQAGGIAKLLNIDQIRNTALFRGIEFNRTTVQSNLLGHDNIRSNASINSVMMEVLGTEVVLGRYTTSGCGITFMVSHALGLHNWNDWMFYQYYKEEP